jgi:hypothetical protein
MLTGAVFFEGGMMQVIHKHANDLPLPAHERNENVPPPISRVLIRALDRLCGGARPDHGAVAGERGPRA